MKKSEIAARVFAAVERRPLEPLRGGPLVVPPADLAALSLVPWYCEGAVQWAVRLASPGSPFRKSPLPRVKGTNPELTPDGALRIGIPGDGIEPSLFAFLPLSQSIGGAVDSSVAAAPGLELELAAANLGIVRADWEVKAETSSPFGDQRYAGTIDAGGRWIVDRTTPGLDRKDLQTALSCGRMVVEKGPWRTADAAEAFAVLMHWFTSPEANVNPVYVQRFFTYRGGEFVSADTKTDRKLCGLGLGFFRCRLAGSPYRWEKRPLMGPHSRAQLEEIARSIVGRAAGGG